MADDDLKEAREDFTLAQDAESDNRTSYEDDVEFALHEVQWPANVAKQRQDENRPALTISKMKAFIRQVVNDARQNKPSIKVHPADSGADPETAEVINGLIRNIEYTSNADVAYDTAMETAVAGGFGYWRVGLDYAYHDSFDMDLRIERVANPLSVYGDPYSTAADSSDWMRAFVVDLMSKRAFEAKYGKDTKTIADWDDGSWHSEGWRVGNDVTVAERWKRSEEEIKVSQFLNLANGEMQTYSDEDLEKSEDLQALLTTGLLEFKRSRNAKSFKVTQQFMTGAEILGETVKWNGCYIPIVPVYGDEYNIKGKRHFRSLIHS
ncbi:MAG TPA: portal protein, partial [Burkholderiaceae bacterium]